MSSAYCTNAGAAEAVDEDVATAALLKQVSPVAWQHINFYGRYEFNKQPEIIDMDIMIQELAQQELVG